MKSVLSCKEQKMSKKITFNDVIQIFEIKMDPEHVAARNGVEWRRAAFERKRLERKIKKVLINKCLDIKDINRIVHLRKYYDSI